jgi:DNA-3-methyladenine glycosylase I
MDRQGGLFAYVCCMKTTDGLIKGTDGKMRCWWHGGDPMYQRYHDEEWGRPVEDDVRLYEKICLEGFQAGLSWFTILKRRDNFRKAFAGFDFVKVAKFKKSDVERLVQDAGIIRHRGKIEAAVNNAQKTNQRLSTSSARSAPISGGSSRNHHPVPSVWITRP